MVLVVVGIIFDSAWIWTLIRNIRHNSKIDLKKTAIKHSGALHYYAWFQHPHFHSLKKKKKKEREKKTRKKDRPTLWVLQFHKLLFCASDLPCRFLNTTKSIITKTCTHSQTPDQWLTAMQSSTCGNKNLPTKCNVEFHLPFSCCCDFTSTYSLTSTSK